MEDALVKGSRSLPLPVGPCANVHAAHEQYLRTPQSQCRGDAPRAASEVERCEITERKCECSPNQRPRSLHETPPAMNVGLRPRKQLSVSPAFQDDARDENDSHEQQAERKRGWHPEALNQRNGADVRQSCPPGEMFCSKRRADDKGRKGHEHAGVSPTGGI